MQFKIIGQIKLPIYNAIICSYSFINMGIINWVSASTFGNNSTNTSEERDVLSSLIAVSTLSKQSLLRKYSQSSQILQSLLSYIANKMEKSSVPNIDLVFRASQHKFKATAFHEQCDGKKNTILIACTSNNKYFGAFTPCQWKKDEMLAYEQDEKSQSFLFRVDGKQLITFDIKPEHNKKAIMNDSECGPVFGEGHDINIVDEADRKENWNNLGHSYKCQFKFGSYKANTELTGQQMYKLKEYEIWEAKFE